MYLNEGWTPFVLASLGFAFSACGGDIEDAATVAGSVSSLSEAGYLDDGDIKSEHMFDVAPRFETELVVDEFGHLQVKHGTACRSGIEPDGYSRFVTFTVEEDIPEWADRATVFMNGWRATYRHGDHHVGSIQARIRDVRVDTARHDIRWNVEGHLVDDNGDDMYALCVKYTVLAWYSPFVGAGVTGRNATELMWFGSGARRPRTSGQGGLHKSLLLTGFRYQWETDRVDRHLHSALYDMAAFRMGDATFDLPEAYFMDNGRRAFRFFEWTDVLSGPQASFYIEDPAKLLLPTPTRGTDWGQGCVPVKVMPDDSLLGAAAHQTQAVTISGIPHRFAVPVLSGWDLHYACGDEHVRDIGIWLDTVRYSYDHGRGTGTMTLNVHSFLGDKDGRPGHFSDFRINVLGFDVTHPPQLHKIRAKGNLTSLGFIRLSCDSSLASCEVTGNFDHMETGCYLDCPHSSVTAECGTNGQEHREIDDFWWRDEDGTRHSLPAGRFSARASQLPTGHDGIEVVCSFTD